MGHGQIEPNQNATLTYLQWDKNLIVECQQLTVNVSFRELIKNVTLKGWGTEALQSIYLVITGKEEIMEKTKKQIFYKKVCVQQQHEWHASLSIYKFGLDLISKHWSVTGIPMRMECMYTNISLSLLLYMDVCV